jgi:tetratricopeptide (TPR) repeat protein
VTARRLILVLTLALAAAGARAQDFYAERMQRGIANYQRGNYAQAAADFRIAAFGLLDVPADYETALIYGVLANQKLGSSDDARQTAEKIVTVERVAPVYTALPIRAELRGEIEAALPKLLRSEQLARVPAFAHLAPRSTAPQAAPQPQRVEPPRPTPTSPASASGARAMSLLQSGDESGARTTAEKVVIDDYTNALAQTVLAILSGRRGDWAGVVEHYSVVRTRRHLTDDENNTFYLGLVRTGRTADAAGVEKLRGLQPFVAKAPTPAPAPTAAPAPAALLADADRTLREGRIIAARDAYRRLAAMPSLSRDVALSAARGLNQTTAYRDSSAAYQKLYPLHNGEEVHMFYEAVNRYEMGDYAIARKLLARALPSLPRTRDVELYRGRIESTQ